METVFSQLGDTLGRNQVLFSAARACVCWYVLPKCVKQNFACIFLHFLSELKKNGTENHIKLHSVSNSLVRMGVAGAAL
jgi:hypothetical protein